jgi:hypothetical protein
MNGAQKSNKNYDENDIAKPTVRQTLTDKQFNTMTTQLVGNYANLTDQAKMTIKQILSTQTYEQIMSSNQKNVYSNLPDKAKETLKTVLTLCEFNTNNRKQPGQNANFQDVANTTLKEILTTLELNTNILGPHIFLASAVRWFSIEASPDLS